MSFALHPQLEADTAAVIDLQVCRVLLMDDSTWPWLILVPALTGMRDLHDVPEEHDTAVMSEIRQVSRALTALYRPDKINVAALGNQVPQLHIHVIVRHTSDPAWPGPVWGTAPRTPYDKEDLETQINRLRTAIERAG